MLGYELDDITKMQDAISLVSDSPMFPSDVRDALEMANSFFDGLWAEGYFE